LPEFLLVEDFTGLALVFFFDVCFVVLCVGCFAVGVAVGAGAALSGAGAGVAAAGAG
jgi:hypothetical protein